MPTDGRLTEGWFVCLVLWARVAGMTPVTDQLVNQLVQQDAKSAVKEHIYRA